MGKAPTAVAVRGELLRTRGVGASMRDVADAIRSWREDWIRDRSAPIGAAVDAFLALATDLERREFARLIGVRSGGAVRVRVTSRRKPPGGRPRQTAL